MAVFFILFEYVHEVTEKVDANIKLSPLYAAGRVL
jgi:hypothetical protein